MNHSDKKAGLRPRGLWLGIVMLLGGLGITGWSAGQEQARSRPQPVGAAVAAGPQITVRGPDAAVVGQSFTLEVILANPTGAAIKNLEFTAEIDGNLQLESGRRSQLESIGSIAAQNVHIVRLQLTPVKKGPARIDIILRSKDGQMQQVQQVIPVTTAEDAPQQPERPAAASPLQATITTPKDCFADTPTLFLIRVHNTGAQATDKTELVVSYGTMASASVHFAQPFNTFGGPGMRRGQIAAVAPSNPVRETRVSIPALAAHDSRTIPVTLTPRRIGEFRLAVTAGSQMIGSVATQARFDPSLSANSLLPATFGNSLAPRLPKTLADVPEVGLEDRVSKTMKADEAFEHIAHMMDKVNHANAKKQDAFVAALLEKRADMAGMPMAMGDSCRLSPERANHFVGQLSQLRMAMAQSPSGTGLMSRFNQQGNPAAKEQEKTASARIGAMMQVLGPENVAMRQEMIKYLAVVQTTEATQSLAKLAIFSEEAQVRQAAIDALKARQAKDYSDVLSRGLNYPWPAVAKNASDAIVKLQRKDMIPQLLATLERPDPRAPSSACDCDEGTLVVREMVKINHLRNCMLCHPPRSNEQFNNTNGNVDIDERIADEKFAEGRVSTTRVLTPLVAQVPIPNQPLPVSPGNGGGYGQFSIPDTLIRFDVTYLRQDFSVMLPVADHQPWPQTQRFDFLVRTRKVTAKEAKTYSDLLRPAAGELTPYQQAAVAALRQLTGRDAQPNAAAWRKALGES